MTTVITHRQPRNGASASMRLPTSKSIANRALVLKNVLGSATHLVEMPDSGDTRRMLDLLGLIARSTGSQERPIPVDAADAGTVARFLCAYLSACPGEWLLTGTDRMQSRPIAGLVDMLHALGARISYADRNGFLPLRISGRQLDGGSLDPGPLPSSQFLSAVMLIAPSMEKGLELRIDSKQVSQPYITMTLELMRAFGVEVSRDAQGIRIGRPGAGIPQYRIEADWSAAAFAYQGFALSGLGTLRLPGLRHDSIQGDAAVAGLFQHFGIRTDIADDGLILKKFAFVPTALDLDMAQQPDLVPAIACCAAGMGISVSMKGVAHLRLKESDRIEALSEELTKLGLIVIAGPDALHVSGKARAFHGVLSTHDDHRMAMALAPLSMACGPLRLDDPEVVRKSFPGYWAEMEKTFGLMREG